MEGALKSTILQLENKKGDLVHFQYDTLLPAALELLIVNNILSAPIFNSMDGLVQVSGQLDMIGICDFVIKKFGHLNSNSSEAQFSAIQKVFQSTTVGSLIEQLDQTFCPVPEDAKLSELLPLLSVYELHRVPVIGKTGEVVRVISQSDLVHHLGKHIPATLASKKLEYFDLIKKQVFSVGLDQLAIEAFKLITIERVSAVGVVDGTGRLVGNISATDIRSVGMNATFSSRLFWSVEKFLNCKSVEFQAPKEVLSVTMQTSFKDIVDLVLRFHLHRVYVTDKAKKPIGIVSLTDILKIIQTQ